jgi:hypothetical protein
MSNKQKFTQLIESSALPESDKEEWRLIIDQSPETLVDTFYETLENYPQELPWFNEIYKRKRTALAMLNANQPEAKNLLAEIYSEEKNKLEKLLNP